ncbi:MAG: phosphate ABC transporter permease PstA [Rhodospirillales bacterium]
MPDGIISDKSSSATAVRDSFLHAAIWGMAIVMAGVFSWFLGDLFMRGAAGLDWSFLTSSPRNAGRGGGIAPMLVSTAAILAVAICIAAPLALATAILLSEFSFTGGPFAKWTGLSLDVLAGVPSIVFGLFGYAFFGVWLGLGFSILSGGLTLACMILPILIRTAEQGLRAAPLEWRHGAAALGMSKATVLRRILIPAAAPALTAGLVLGIGRAMAETAALIHTSGYVDRMPASLLDSGRALSVHIYDLSMNVAGGDRNAYAAALFLVISLILINGAALWLADRTFRKRITTA